MGALLANGRPSVVWLAVNAMFAANGAPWSLRNVPDTCTATFGTVYDPRPVKRVTQPVGVLHQGLVGDNGATFCSGSAARTSQ